MSGPGTTLRGSGLRGSGRAGSGRAGSDRAGSGRAGSGRTGSGLAGRLPIDPRFARRLTEIRRNEGRRRLRILAAAGAAVVVVAAAVGSLYSPWLDLRHVRMAAIGAVPRSEVLSVTGLNHPRPLIEIDTARLAARLDAVVDLGGARVSRAWPATVAIEVTQRTPVAAVAQPASAGSPAGWATVDATGRVLADLAAPPPGLPVVQNAGPVPLPGQWLAGSAGPGADPLPPAGTGPAISRSLVDLDAPADSADVPAGTAAALAVAAALPASMRETVQSVRAGPGRALMMSVLPITIASGSIPVTLGDGSFLSQKLMALAALLTEGDLSGAKGINLSVPDRPAVAMAES
jgi:hypothetical protein